MALAWINFVFFTLIICLIAMIRGKVSYPDNLKKVSFKLNFCDN